MEMETETTAGEGAVSLGADAIAKTGEWAAPFGADAIAKTGEWAAPFGADAIAKSSRARSRALAAVQARPRWWLELLTIAWLAWGYDIINNLAPLRHSTAIGHALGILSLEQTLHLDPELALNRWVAAHHALGV